MGNRYFRGGGWRRRPHIGHKIRNGKVRFMTDSADDRLAASRNGPGHAFLVKSPQVLHAAATPSHNDNVHRVQPVQQRNTRGNFPGRAFALHLNRAQVQRHSRKAPSADPGNIVNDRAGLAGYHANAFGQQWQRLFQACIKQAFPRQPALQLLKTKVQISQPVRFHRIGVKLVCARFGI